jgi:hypothetical protein
VWVVAVTVYEICLWECEGSALVCDSSRQREIVFEGLRMSGLLIARCINFIFESLML